MTLPAGPRSPSLVQIWHYMRRPLPFLEDCAQRFGKRFTLRFSGGRAFVLTWDENDVRAVFTGSTDIYLSGRGNERMKPFLGPGSLFVLDGDAHRRHRKLIAPPFQGERLRGHAAPIAAITARSLARWPRGRVFPVLRPMHAIALEAIFETVFGVREAARVARLERLVRRFVASPTALAFVPALQVDLGPVSPWGRLLRTRRALQAALEEEVRRARTAAGTREDLLARLLEESARSPEPFSDAEVADELLTLLLAGHETTAAGLAWAFRWILGTPGVHERIRDEVRAVAGSRPIDAAALAEMRLLDAAVHETLRLSPPVPIALRWLAAPVALGGFDLPAGTVVAPCPYLAHRDPAVFPDPLRFDPARFLGRRPGPFQLFPFGGGNRLCVGLAFAVLEMKAVLATVFARVDLRLACDVLGP